MFNGRTILFQNLILRLCEIFKTIERNTNNAFSCFYHKGYCISEFISNSKKDLLNIGDYKKNNLGNNIIKHRKIRKELHYLGDEWIEVFNTYITEYYTVDEIYYGCIEFLLNKNKDIRINYSLEQVAHTLLPRNIRGTFHIYIDNEYKDIGYISKEEIYSFRNKYRKELKIIRNRIEINKSLLRKK